jgi:hypothetical protein
MGPEQEGGEGDVETGEGDPSSSGYGAMAAGALGSIGSDDDFGSVAQGMLGLADNDSDSDSDSDD